MHRIESMPFFSLKWKLSLSFVIMALGFVGLYVALAKRTFEHDKISYIFETQQREVSSLSATAKFQIERILFDARSIISGFDPQTQKIAESNQKLFWDHPNLLALKLTFKDANDKEQALNLEKVEGLASDAVAATGPEDRPALTSLDGNRFTLAVKEKDGAGRAIGIHIIFDIPNILPDGSKGQSLVLVTEEKVIRASPSTTLPVSAIQSLLAEQGPAGFDQTSFFDVAGSRHLVSSAQIGFGDFRFVSLISEETALGALNVLFRRSLIFIAFSFFATVILSMIVANRLTKNINSLTVSAEKLGGGDFSVKPEFTSNDEVGILSRTFFKMASEIERLLVQMVDKARMESEFQTARLVQESLFPERKSYQNGKVRLAGNYKTTTECGGDWWYYYQKGPTLYILIADATGHGVPAALITAAARSLFAYIRNKDFDIKQIAEAWDHSVYECSQGKVFMTALVASLNVELGELAIINAGHELPILMSGEKRSGEYMDLHVNFSLGERRGKWVVNHFQLKPHDRVLFYTDGLLAVESPEGKTYSDRRFLQLVERLAAKNPTPDQLISELDKTFTDLAGTKPIPDDITLLAIDYGF